ncbi:MAG: glycoside hydrolase family 53 protein [Planctomycetota bacterium]
MMGRNIELLKPLRQAYLVLLVLTIVCTATSSEHQRTSTHDREFLLGGDISALAEIEQHGGVFRDQGKPVDAIRILRNYGCNCFRLRLFVNPAYRNVVVNDLPYTIALARRIKAAGAKLLLNFHYSDTWADPGKQTKPKAWKDLDFESLERIIYEYTRDCILEFKKADVLPDMVQPGNEITPGMLWSDGKLQGVGKPEKQWENFTQLLKAAIRGVKDASANSNIRIVLHIHCGGDWSKTKWFFENIEKQRVPYDIIGLSYYPWWHGSMEDLRENLSNTASTFDKDIFVVETAYPNRSVRFSKSKEDKDKNMNWPMTPVGQKTFLEELIGTVRQTPKGHGLGVLWWYPESIPVKDLRVWYGGANALFDSDGNTLPAVNAFKEIAHRQNEKADFHN